MITERKFMHASICFVIFLSSVCLARETSLPDKAEVSTLIQNAREVDNYLNNKTSCLENNETTLREISVKQQLEIGDLLKKEREVEDELKSKNDTLGIYAKKIDELNTSINQNYFYMKINSDKAYVINVSYQDCTEKWGILSFICDVKYKANAYEDEIEELKSNNDRLYQAIASSEKSIAEVNDQKSKLLELVDANKKDVERVKAEKDKTLGELSQVKHNLEVVFNHSQRIHSLERRVSLLLDELNIDLSDSGRKLALYQATDDYKKLSELLLIIHSSPLIHGIVLSDGNKICAD